MANSFYIHKGGDRNHISHLIPYIRDAQLNNTVWHYHPENITNSNSENIEVSHTLLVVGNPSEKILYAYIELFSAFKFLVLLSDSYIGKEYQEFYSFDVIGRKEIDKSVDINLSREEVLKTVTLRVNNLQQVENSSSRLLKAITNKQISEQLSKKSEEVLENLFKDIPGNTPMTEEVFAELLEKYTDGIGVFLHEKRFFNQE